MKRSLTWTKFKLPQVSLSDTIDDEDEDNDWELFEKKKYKDSIDRLESMGGGSRILSTPLGSVHLDGSEESNKLFNIWIGHTNFDLTPQHYAAMEYVEGVEALQPISRYRFQLAIGFQFDETKVRMRVEEALVGSLKTDLVEVLSVYQLANPTLTKKLSQTLEAAISGIKNKTWVSFMPPNGEVKLVVSDKVDDEFFEEATILGLAQSLATGHVDSSLLRGE